MMQISPIHNSYSMLNSKVVIPVHAYRHWVISQTTQSRSDAHKRLKNSSHVFACVCRVLCRSSSLQCWILAGSWWAIFWRTWSSWAELWVKEWMIQSILSIWSSTVFWSPISPAGVRAHTTRLIFDTCHIELLLRKFKKCNILLL